MLNRAASFLQRFEHSLNNFYPLPDYSHSPFADCQTGDIEGFKSSVIELIAEYLNVHSCTLRNKQRVLSLIEKLKTANQYSAVYTHLSIAIIQTEKALLLPYFSALLDYARNFPGFKDDLDAKRKERPSSNSIEQASVYYNLVEAAAFETDLALSILTSAPKETLEKVNNKIIDYCENNVTGLKEEALRRQLIKYYVCEPSEFDTVSPSEKFIALLKRDLNHPQHVSECATLHLIFFNYEHIYEVLEFGTTAQLTRDEIHMKVRPNRQGQMFNTQIRGRDTVIANNKTKEFGITIPEHVPQWGREWHRYETTPHKYRSGLNPYSPILKHFRSNGIPYIAGPSGTAADCAEGLHFLCDELVQQEIQEYFNLLAAAEVAQGHHSFHEIILPLCNLNWYDPFDDKCHAAVGHKEKETVRKYKRQPWAYLDYQRSYEDFLSDQFKQTDEYKKLCDRYPHYLDPHRFVMEPVQDFLNPIKKTEVVYWQRMLRAKKTYAELNGGSLWKESLLTKNMTLDIEEFKKLSKKNVNDLIAELGTLTPEEIEFFKCFMDQTTELTHYTNRSDAIFSTGSLQSYTTLQNKYGKDNFEGNSSSGDIAKLGNGGSVFFRFELEHQPQYPSRFGQEQFVVEAKSTSLFNSGWISLYDMVLPHKSNNVKCLKHHNQEIRSMVSSALGQITYRYPAKIYTIDMMSTVFFGPDIKRGIALSMIAELRRIGGAYQQTVLSNRTLEGLNAALSQLFRVEAKIPGRVYLAEVDYYYTAPLLMKEAIDRNNLDDVKELLRKGMSIDDIIFDGKTSLEYVLSLSDKKYDPIAHYFLRKRNGDLFFEKNQYQYIENENQPEENTLLSIKNASPYFEDASNLKVVSCSMNNEIEIKTLKGHYSNETYHGDYLLFNAPKDHLAEQKPETKKEDLSSFVLKLFDVKENPFIKTLPCYNEIHSILEKK